MNTYAPLSPAASPALSELERDRLGSLALDQWRGLALVLVLISHGFYFTGRVHGIGRVGVNLFFFISGVLVFRSLSRTRAATDWERTKSFWWRRFRRLYPAMTVYALAMILPTWWWQQQPVLPPHSDVVSYAKSLPLALGYVINYTTGEAPMALRHLWSLACGMQFYLVAPLIFWLGGRLGPKRDWWYGFLLASLLAIGMAQPLIRSWQFHQFNTEVAVWPMMLGFCCEYKRHWFQKIPATLVSLVLWLSAFICATALVLTLFGFEMKILVIAIGAFLLAPCWLAYLFGCPMTGTGGRWLKWLGERTYSIYLWQQPLTICRFLPYLLHPAGALLSIAIGGLWFHFFERPFLSASRREQPPAVAPGNFLQRNWIALGSVALLLAWMAIAWRLEGRYEIALRHQIWPVGAPPTGVLTNASATAAPTVLLLGDSRMAEWGLPELGSNRVVNAGAGGWTTAQVRLRTTELLDEFHPAVVVVQAGINDLKYLGLEPELADSLVSLVRSNLTAIVDDCVQHHCRVIVLEVWPASDPPLSRRLIWNDTIGASVNRLNAELRALDAPEKGVRIVDLFQRAGLKPGPGQFRDTLHFKKETYERLTSALKTELRAVITE
jgi:peptidoglycan/LPS O-acetylase OafA/YrhL/lysophospholipase L1-like esterase